MRLRLLLVIIPGHADLAGDVLVARGELHAGAGGLLADSQISFGVQNVFNTSPPIEASSILLAGGYSSYGDPRLRRYALVVTKNFGL